MIYIIPCLLLVTAVLAQHHPEEQLHQEHDGHEEYHEPNYKFEYKVEDHKTGDYKTHRESRKGDKVNGYYMLKEADGTMREVHYTADKHSGFNAVVSKSGHPHVEEHESKEEHHKGGHAVHYGHVHEVHKPVHHEKEELQLEFKPYVVSHHSPSAHHLHKEVTNKKEEDTEKHSEHSEASIASFRHVFRPHEAMEYHHEQPKFTHEIHHYDGQVGGNYYPAAQYQHGEQIKRDIFYRRHQYRGQGRENKNNYHVMENVHN